MSESNRMNSTVTQMEIDALTNRSFELRLSSPSDGLAYAHRAYELAQQLQYERGVADAHFALGVCSLLLWRFEESEQHLKEALTYRESRDRLAFASTLRWLAFVKLQAGDPGSAINAAAESLQVAVRENDAAGQAASLNYLGMAFYTVFNLENAWRCWKRSEFVYTRASDAVGLSHTCANLGSIYFEIGRVVKALRYFRRALELKRFGGDSWNRSGVERNLGNCLFRLNRYADSRTYFEAAIESARQVRSPAAEALALSDLSRILEEGGDRKRASVLLSDAHEIAMRCSSPRVKAEILIDFGGFLARGGDLEQGIQNLRAGLSISTEHWFSDLTLNAHGELANAFEHKRSYKATVDSLRAAAAIKDEIDASRYKLVNLLLSKCRRVLDKHRSRAPDGRVASGQRPRLSDLQENGLSKTIVAARQEFEMLKLKRAITHDALTGAWNRGYFEQVLPNRVAYAQESKQSLFLAMLDIDYFKRINDEHGHQTGDAVLTQIAALAISKFQGADVFRYGGEEFAVRFPADISPGEAVEEFRKSVAEYEFTSGHGPIHATVSIGLTAVSQSEDAKSLVERADHYLYNAKMEGRNKVVSDIATE